MTTAEQQTVERADRIIAALRDERYAFAEALRQEAIERRPGGPGASSRSEGYLEGLRVALKIAETTR